MSAPRSERRSKREIRKLELGNKHRWHAGRTVARSSSIAVNTARASNVADGRMIVAPLVTQLSTAQTHPAQW